MSSAVRIHVSLYCMYTYILYTLTDILPMLSPEDIVSSEVPDSLFMVSYISQFYSSLRDKHPAGGE